MSRFKFWSTTAYNEEDYVECSFSEMQPRGYYGYVNLNNDPRFPVDFSKPPSEASENDTPEQIIYRKEYESYMSRKSLYQPLWKLHISTFERAELIAEQLNNSDI